ncbi:DUF3224 domain-containing protein [Streptomyces nojiriensis]|uniref:DUF3224 domain-containing protein n=1 Tax=Streptomyces nojiriensis TaxID=66374 RepID=UPI0035DC2FE7
MRAAGTFTVEAFVPTGLKPEPAVPTGLPVGVATMEKTFEGEVAGRSATLFTAAFDQGPASAPIAVTANLCRLARCAGWK